MSVTADQMAFAELAEGEEIAFSSEVDWVEPDGPDSLKLFLGGLRRYEVLTPERERDLARRVAHGDRSAREALVHHNLRLLISVVKRYRGQGLSLLDLIQEGYFGLSHAVDRFDYRRGYKFSTYATVWIRQACLRAIAARGQAIGMPEYVRSRRLLLQRTGPELAARLGREPNTQELAAATGIAVEHVEEALGAAVVATSIDADRKSDETLLAHLTDESGEDPVETAERQRLRRATNEALATLMPLERTILQLRFGAIGDREHTLEEIAAQLHLSRGRVRILEAEALTTLAPRLAFLIGRSD